MMCLPGKRRRWERNVIRVKYCSVLAVFLLAICGLPLIAQAAAYPSAISVRAILPENQVEGVSYFDLLMSPGASQTVQMQINNAENRPVDASVELNPASTGLNGTIVYSNANARDDSITHPIKDIANVRENIVRIPANGTALVDIDINMPDEAIEGVILGGLRVTADYPEGEAENSVTDTAAGEQGIRINNKFAYVIGLKLSQDEAAVKPEFHLKSIQPKLVNYSASVVLNIQNSEASIAKNMAVSAKVYQKGSDKVLREFTKDNAEMAPNSNCDYVVDWGNRQIAPGTYRVLASVKHEDRIWEWDEEFTVEAEEANTINSGALGLDKGMGIPYWVYALGSLLVILIVIATIILFRLNSKRENA